MYTEEIDLREWDKRLTDLKYVYESKSNPSKGSPSEGVTGCHSINKKIGV